MLMKQITNASLWVICLMVSITCGSPGDSPLDGAGSKPTAAAGRQAIQAKDWSTAIAAYKELVDGGTKDYTNHLGLAVAYAGSICIEVLNLVGASEGADSPLAIAGGLNTCTLAQETAGTCCHIRVPSSYDSGDSDFDQIDYKGDQMQLAITALSGIPEANRADSNIASSFTTHFALFNLLAAQLLQYKYTQLASVDVNDLTEDDADALIEFLEAGGSLEGSGFSDSINEQLSQIESMPGATNADKVKAFMNQ